MLKILLIDCTATEYDGSSAARGPLRGTQTGTYELSRALAARGHGVTVANATPESSEAEGVFWIPRSEIGARRADVVVLNNDAHLFDLARPALSAGAAPVLWHHNPFRPSRTLRRKNLAALFRWRPVGVFMSEAHKKKFPRLLPYRSRIAIGYAISSVFRTIAPATEPPPMRAIFASVASRGLGDMIGLWIARIAPALPQAEFHAYVGGGAETGFSPEILAAHRVVLRERVPKPALAEAMRDARVMIYPGHPEETFCQTAAECLCAGTPIVTRGIGSLRERVRDGVDGFIAPDDPGFASRTIEILRDDTLWHRLHERALELRPVFDWNNAVRPWEDLFMSLTSPIGMAAQ
jgi:hypothetical protein